MTANDSFPVAERFVSINGEGRRVGQLAVFIRFAGCNLACGYCDTAWANAPDAPHTACTAADLADYVRGTGVHNVTLTGGEPLLQPHLPELLGTLADIPNVQVEIETNGSQPIDTIQALPRPPSLTMDYKLPSSGMEAHMLLGNLNHLQPKDTIKFVVGDMNDLTRARHLIQEYDLTNRCAVYISPVFGAIAPEAIVDYMKTHKLNGVTLQLQLHKIIWRADKRGV